MPGPSFKDLTEGPITDPSRIKALKTIMNDRKVSFDEARKIQARAILRDDDSPNADPPKQSKRVKL